MYDWRASRRLRCSFEVGPVSLGYAELAHKFVSRQHVRGALSLSSADDEQVLGTLLVVGGVLLLLKPPAR